MRNLFLSAFITFTSIPATFAGDGSSVGSVAAMREKVATLQLSSSDYRRLKARLDMTDSRPVMIPETGVLAEKVDATIRTVEPQTRIVVPELNHR